MKPLVATSTKVQTADSYRFTFDDFRCQWAIFTVNNSTGEFSIQSDAGSWSHRWNSSGFTKEEQQSSKPLAQFLGKCDAGYVLDKLGYARTRDLDMEFDAAATKKDLRDKILEIRRGDEVTKDAARAAWNQLDDWLTDFDFETEIGRNKACEDFKDYDPLSVVFYRYEIYELFRYKPSQTHDFLYHDLLPFFKEYLKNEVLK